MSNEIKKDGRFTLWPDGDIEIWHLVHERDDDHECE